ncbi:hypothetical protein DENSPDRAFT_887175 [Dentipellis sp. KUC8613]|nr:hypothetical protein DENSPDRAFT_887175 [Dentipellis sp. KUC8613]
MPVVPRPTLLTPSRPLAARGTAMLPSYAPIPVATLVHPRAAATRTHVAVTHAHGSLCTPGVSFRGRDPTTLPCIPTMPPRPCDTAQHPRDAARYPSDAPTTSPFVPPPPSRVAAPALPHLHASPPQPHHAWAWLHCVPAASSLTPPPPSRAAATTVHPHAAAPQPCHAPASPSHPCRPRACPRCRPGLPRHHHMRPRGHHAPERRPTDTISRLSDTISVISCPTDAVSPANPICRPSSAVWHQRCCCVP